MSTREFINPDFGRDVLESDIPRDVLDILLLDRTTGRNILWMSDNYAQLESVFDAKMGMRDEMDADVISRPGSKIIRPRVDKSKAEQRERVQKKAEVFTPSWICNNMLNDVDAAWFGRKSSPFTTTGNREERWKRCEAQVAFPGGEGQSWLDYVNERRLEMCCGEAPFLASRYDTTTGEVIPVPDRIGILDRKLRVVTENAGTATVSSFSPRSRTCRATPSSRATNRFSPIPSTCSSSTKPISPPAPRHMESPSAFPRDTRKRMPRKRPTRKKSPWPSRRSTRKSASTSPARPTAS